MPLDRYRRGAGDLMAQLTDDCFAFSGPLLPVDEVERMMREQRAGRSPRPRRWRSQMRAAASLARDVVAPIDLPPFDNSAVDGYAVRHADLAASGETALARRRSRHRRHARRARRRRGRRRSASSPARRCRPAPTPCSCRRTCRADGDSVIVPPGLKRGANRRLAGEDIRGRRAGAAGRAAAVDRPTSRSPPRSGSTDSRCGGACASRCSRPATKWSSPASRCARGASTMPTAICCSRCSQLGARRHRSRHPAGRSRDARARDRRGRRAAMTSCSPRAASRPARPIMCATRSRRIGRLVFWRVAIKPGRPVAMGVIPARRQRRFVGCRAIRSRCS